MLPSSSSASRSGPVVDAFGRAAVLSSASTARAERQPLLSGAPPPQVFAHPIECASLTSRLLLQWVSPSVTLANRLQSPQESYHPLQPQRRPSLRGLQQSDVWELPPRARAEPAANALQRAWIASGSLSLAFLKAHGLQFAGLGLLHLVVQLCDLLGPYVLYRSVLLLQDEQQRQDEATESDRETTRRLLFWLSVLLFSRLLRALLSSFVCAELRTTTLRLTAALQSLVFQKALRLPNAPTKETDGLYAKDVTQLLQGAACVHELWAAPLTLALTLTLLARFVGVSACGMATGVALCMLALSQVLRELQRRSLDRLRRTRKDRQVAANDMVLAMPAVKLHAWEPSARSRVNATRGCELAALWRFQSLGAAEAAVSFATPILVATAALAVCYRSATHPLTAATAFATLALIRLIQTPLRTTPEAILGACSAWISLHNLSNFMDQEELDPYAVAHRDSLGMVAKYDPQSVVVAVEDATLGWAATGPLLFNHLDVIIGAGECWVVHGRPGSGKSSFLAALLGEMQSRDGSDGGNTSGRVYVGGSVAYCPQHPWLQQGMSVRDNILFGLSYDRRKYQRVLDACALIDTFAMLSTGDNTLIQHWMPTPAQQALVSLARACYSDADVYLLDEPLLNVRPKSLAREIFSRCMLGLLRNKTRVIVTTRPEFINSEHVDDAVRFEDGGRLVHTRDVFDANTHQEKDGDSDDEEADAADWVHISHSGAGIASPFQNPYCPMEEPIDAEELSMENIVNMTRPSLNDRPLREYLSCETIEETQRGEGKRLHKAVRAYTQAVGGVRVVVVLFLLLALWQVLQLLSELWVAYWVRSSDPTNFVADQLIYASLAVSAGLLALSFAMMIAVAAVEGARRVFVSLTGAFLHAPLVFFDAFGAGSGRAKSKRLSLARRRELERAFTSRDLSDVDTRLPLAVGGILALGASILTALLTTLAITRFYAVLLAPVVYMYMHAAKLYLRPARDLLHLEHSARHTARVHAAESMNGARVVRAFGLAHVHQVLGHHFWLLDVAARDGHLGLHVDQWLALRVQMYSAVIVGVVAASSFLALRHTLSVGLLGLAVYEALTVDSGALESLVRAWAWLSPTLPTVVRIESAVKGAEVITTTATYSTAAARRGSAPITPAQSEINPSLSWPAKGDLRFDAVSYRDPAAAVVDDLADMFDIGDGGAPPLALKGVSFRLQAGEKVAILESSVTSSVSSVGRALLRVHELTAGRIVVDGVDIATLGLRTLRSRVACVSAAAPSTALYDGSVRTQLDPSGVNGEDERLWAALRAVGLSCDVVSLDAPLPGVPALHQDPCKLFLLSLARALLTEPSVVVLALAPVLAMPPEDELELFPEPLFVLDDIVATTLLRVMEEELRDATVLLLLPSTASPQQDQAQRSVLLNAVGRVLVVVDGEMAELSTPPKLTRVNEGQPESPGGKLQLSDLDHPNDSMDQDRISEQDDEEEHASDERGLVDESMYEEKDATGVDKE